MNDQNNPEKKESFSIDDSLESMLGILKKDKSNPGVPHSGKADKASGNISEKHDDIKSRTFDENDIDSVLNVFKKQNNKPAPSAKDLLFGDDESGVNNYTASNDNIKNKASGDNAGTLSFSKVKIPPKSQAPVKSNSISKEKKTVTPAPALKKQKKEKSVYDDSDDIDEENTVFFDEIDKISALPKKEQKKRSFFKKSFMGGAYGGIVKTVLYISFVVVFSLISSIYIISIGNDVFAFSKDTKEVIITIPENTSSKELAKLLHENGIIKYPGIFKMYANKKISKNKNYTGKFKSGDFPLSPNMSYDTFISNLCERAVYRETVKITIPEGLTLDETLNLLVEKGIGTKEGYIEAVNNYDFNYKFVKELSKDKLSKDRTYRLEGYLFPDTYEFYTDEGEVSALNRLLSNFDSKFESVFYDRAKELGMSVDEVITLSSIIEKEAKFVSEYKTISSVLHNRLYRSDYYSKSVEPGKIIDTLESDATVQYALGKRKTELEAKDMKISHPYNTYINKGLPPGPISNPGLEAIIAALYPDNTDYFYFFSKKDGTTEFSKTYSQHQSQIAKAKAEGNF